MAKDSLAKASTPEPFSSSRTSNWVARGGGLPAYIQHIAHDLMEKRGKSESNAIQMAIGIVKNWASGKGNVDANTRAAAAKALAEWEKLKAGARVKEAVYTSLGVSEASDGDAEDKKDGGADESSEMPSVYCVKCSKKVKPTAGKKCPTCGSDLSKAVAAARKVREAVLESYNAQLHPRGRGGQWTAKSGSSGSEVQGIQNQVGATADGKYGEKTTKAVRQFQRSNGLHVDGVVGRQTVAAMRGKSNASKVKVGGMTAADRRWLAKHAAG
jgi:murein L,D-transpeptidase YcbB/YkuD